MKQIVVAIFLAVVIGIDAQADCTGKPDGPCCAGCHAYTYCENQNGTHVECPPPEWVYSDIVKGCALAIDTPPPCGDYTNCTGLPDARYPDMTPGIECEYYFTCLSGFNMGMNPCNPPDDHLLVFHYQMQVCDFRPNTPEPCGILDVDP